MDKTSSVRTRFAPSPTGFLHIGSLRTALYAYALAKHSKGEFILRIEDTDQKREVKGATKELKKTMTSFGLVWDEYYVQSERKASGIYQKAAEKLVSEGHAFYCDCKSKNAKEDGYSSSVRDECRNKNLTSGAVRLKVPDSQKISYFDFVHKKEIAWDSDTVYDATLLKSDGFPTYHLAAMVDDLDMKISHILRGHDWLPSTPIHLLVFEYLGGKRPKIGHLTDILSSTTNKKLSKRRDSVFVEQFIKEGYLPDALLNFVMLLGWAPKDNREMFTLEEFVKLFNIDGFQEANPRFLTEKLDWFNGQYIRKISNDKLIEMINEVFNNKYDKKILIKTIPIIKDRIAKLTDYSQLADFFYEAPKVDKKILGSAADEHLRSAVKVLGDLSEWNLQKINDGLMDEIKSNSYKVGDFFMDLRIAITGKKFTPPINESIEILGKDETLSRINSVLETNK